MAFLKLCFDKLYEKLGPVLQKKKKKFIAAWRVNPGVELINEWKDEYTRPGFMGGSYAAEFLVMTTSLGIS
jgi:hypothetical protein